MESKLDIDNILEDFLEIETPTGPETTESRLLRLLVVCSLRIEDSAVELSNIKLDSNHRRFSILRKLYNVRHIINDIIETIENID